MLRTSTLVLAALLAASLVTPPAAAASIAADIQDNTFEPDPILAENGDTITWTNRDFATHTVTCDVASCEFASDFLGNLDTFATTLDHGGTFSYFCQVHSQMTGRIFAGTLGAGPDLAPDASTLAARRPDALAGVPVPSPTQARLSIEIENAGDAASGPFDVAFLTTSADGSPTTLGTATLASLAPGARATAEVAWLGAPLLGGATVTVIVDGENAIVESHETDNVVTGTVTAALV